MLPELFISDEELSIARREMSNIVYTPFLSINYRTANYAIANAQSQYVGQKELTPKIFLSSEKIGASNNPVGVQSYDNVDNLHSILTRNLDNGNNKLLIVPDVATKIAMEIYFEKQLEQLNPVTGLPLLRILTAMDAQGEESTEVYIQVLPSDTINSINNPEGFKPLNSDQKN